MPLPTFVFSENVVFYISWKSTAVLFDQSTEYRYRGYFLDQVPSIGTAVLLKSIVPTSAYVDKLLSCRKSSGINFYIAVTATNVMIGHLVHVPTIISQLIIPLPLFSSFELRSLHVSLSWNKKSVNE